MLVTNHTAIKATVECYNGHRYENLDASHTTINAIVEMLKKDIVQQARQQLESLIKDATIL